MKKKKIIIILLYALLFCFFLFWNLIIQPLNIDEIWNYGFAYAISKGEIPYRDFNMVLTPLYSYVMAFGLKLFGTSIVILHIENAIVLTTFVGICSKILKEKAYLVLLFLIFPISLNFPSYNVFILLLFSILIYLEKNNYNDYLIGIVLGLAILTKQSVGICLALVTVYYLIKKEWHVFLKRIVGISIPCFIFLLYLSLTKSLMPFLDLCVLGLFDFASNNTAGAFIPTYCILFVIIMLINIILIFKDKNDITLYYSLMALSVVLPLIDRYHFYIGFIAFLIATLTKINNIKFINIKLFTRGILLFVIIIYSIDRFNSKIIYPNNINHFEYKYIDQDSIDFTHEVLNYIEKNPKKEFIFLNANAYYFRIIKDEKISYTDLINKGNWGYNGNKKILNTLSKKKDAIFLVQKSDLAEISQTNKDILNYVIKNGKKIGNIRIYDIYILN